MVPQIGAQLAVLAVSIVHCGEAEAPEQPRESRSLTFPCLAQRTKEPIVVGIVVDHTRVICLNPVDEFPRHLLFGCPLAEPKPECGRRFLARLLGAR